MYLTQRHYIKAANPLFAEADKLAFLSKNLYNVVLYETRQQFFAGTLSLGRTYWQHHFVETHNPDFYALSSKAAQGVVHQVLREWQSYFSTLASHKKTPTKFKAAPKIPRYKNKTLGRNALFWPSEAISKRPLNRGYVQPNRTTLQTSSHIPSKLLQQIRLVPDGDGYWMELVYNATERQMATITGQGAAGIDVGVNNLAAIVTNLPGEAPLLVNGRPLKSINHRYNMLLAKEKCQWDIYRSQLEELHSQGKYPYHTRRTRRTSHKRKMQINNYLHHASTYIVKYLASKSVSILVIGKNKGWKQATTLGRRNNQNFVQIPFAKFIDQLKYKCSLAGITLLTTEEGYTSKCSFLDREPCQKKADKPYLGRRINRGLFKAANGQIVNADINGAANILTKVIPNAFAEGIAGVLVRPRKITPVIYVPKVAKKSVGSN